MPGSLAFFLAICVLCLHQQTAQACSCFPSHRQMKFCSSNIVVRVLVVEENKEPSQDQPALRSYTLILKTIYQAFQKMAIIKVYTPLEGSLCGIRLKINEEYVLGGNMDSEGRFKIGACNLVLEWNRLTVSEKYHITHLYKKGCGCKIKFCIDHPCPPATPKECLWKDFQNNLPCLPCKDGTCQWTCDFPFPNQVGLQNAIEP